MVNVSSDLGVSRMLQFAVALAVAVVLAKSAVLHGNESPGSICEIENGVKGHCETVTSCIENGGVTTRNGTMKMCAKSGGNEYVCCRRPFEISQNRARSFSMSFMRDGVKGLLKVQFVVTGSLTGGKIGATLRRCRWQPAQMLGMDSSQKSFEDYIISFGDHNIYESEADTLSRAVGGVPSGLAGENELHFETRQNAPVKQVVKVAEVIIHPDYDTPYNDLALLKFETPVVLTKRVLPACLPTILDEDYLGFTLTAAGWGRGQYESYQFSAVLQKVDLPVIDRLTCLHDLERVNARLIPKGLPQELLCAGEEGKDSCKVDSGGPLLLEGLDPKESFVNCEHTIAGVSSFDSGCGRFGVYGRVSSYMDWITGYIAPGLVPVPGLASSIQHQNQPASNNQPINFPG